MTIRGCAVAMKLGLSVFALFVFLSACGSSEKPELILTSNGLGSIGAGTTYSVEAVSEALPGYEITAETYYPEGYPHPMIVVREGDETIAYVYPSLEGDDKIRSVSVVTTRATFEGKFSLGNSYTHVMPDYQTCLAGFEFELGSVFCRDRVLHNVYFEFFPSDAGLRDEYLGVVPPEHELAQYVVVSINWHRVDR